MQRRRPSIITLAALLAVLTEVRGFALPASGLMTRPLRLADIPAASRLLVNVFTEQEQVNAISRALIFVEHLVGLRERLPQNVILVCEQPSIHKDQLIGTNALDSVEQSLAPCFLCPRPFLGSPPNSKQPCSHVRTRMIVYSQNVYLRE